MKVEPTGHSPGFESESHRAQFARCLWNGVVPPKFSYAGTSAYGQAALAATSGYRAVTNAVDLEVDVLRRHIGPAGECQIAEIGPGTGGHTVDLIQGLKAVSDPLRVQYLGLDFSATMLNLARSVLKTITEPEMALTTWDIDEGPTDAIHQWRSAGMVLTLMLGNTLANLDYPIDALRNIRASLIAGDALMLGISLAADEIDPERTIEPYRTSEFRATVLEPFRAAGVDIEACDFELFYQEGEIVAFVTLGVDYQHELGVLPAGRRIKCFRSRRFSTDALSRVLLEAGFAPSDTVVRGFGSHGVILGLI